MNKSVLKKLFSEKEQSVELSEVQKIELGLSQDITNDSQKATDLYSNGASEVVKAQQLADAGSKKMKEAQNIMATVLLDIDKLEKKAEEIGIPMPKPIAEIKANAKRQESRYKVIAEIEKFAKAGL